MALANLRQKLSAVKRLALTIDGSLDHHAIGVDTDSLWHWHTDELITTHRIWINCEIEKNGISRRGRSFEEAYSLVEERIKKWKEEQDANREMEELFT
jgi:hypothetical protein